MRYVAPRALESDVDDVRLEHADLPELDDDRLTVECCRVVHAIGQRDDRDPDLEWLLVRFAAVRAERRARGQPGKQSGAGSAV